MADADGTNIPGSVVDAASDPIILREKLVKYQHAVTQMKDKIATLDTKLKAKERSLAELAPFVEQLKSSVLSSTNSDDPSEPGFRVTAKVVTEDVLLAAEGGERRSWTWVCIGDELEARQEWHTLEVLLARYPGLSKPLQSLEPHVSPADASDLRSRILEQQEEMRKYRVRAETLLRQKDAELGAARGKALQAQSERIAERGPAAFATAAITAAEEERARARGEHSSGSSGSHGVRVEELAAQVERLLRQRAEAQEREASLREAADELANECAAQREELAALQARLGVSISGGGGVPGGGSGGGTGGADDFAGGPGGGRAAALAAVAASTAAAEAFAAASGGQLGAEGGHLHSHPSAAAAVAALTEKLAAAEAGLSALGSEHSLLALAHDKLQTEYGSYRRRAVGMMKDKDDSLRRVSEELTAARTKLKAGAAAAAAAGGSGGESPGGGIGSGAPSLGPRTGSVSSFSSPGGQHSPHHHPAAAGPSAASLAPPDRAKWEYLRNILVRYLAAGASPDAATMRASLEPAIMTVLGLSQLEKAGVNASARAHAGSSAGHGGGGGGAAASPLTSIWSTATSFMGGLSSAAAAAAGSAAASTVFSPGGAAPTPTRDLAFGSGGGGPSLHSPFHSVPMVPYPLPGAESDPGSERGAGTGL